MWCSHDASKTSSVTVQVKKLDEEERKTVEYDAQVSVGLYISIYTSTVFFLVWFYILTQYFVCVFLLQASRYLSYLVYPLCISGAIFSLAYLRQKKWADHFI